MRKGYVNKVGGLELEVWGLYVYLTHPHVGEIQKPTATESV